MASSSFMTDVVFVFNNAYLINKALWENIIVYFELRIEVH